jgi:serine/threonine protein kinase
MSTSVGKYEVLTRLAKGGMAELSLAATSGAGGFRKFVVIKQILPEAAEDDNFVRMFLDEARVTAAFSHPSICQVFEMGDDPRTGLYVAMEFIAGQDLNQVVAACARQQAVLPVGFSASVVHDCALALHYAHTFKLPNGDESPVVHRDVAQKNIMVTYEGQVKLLDFGIAKAKGALARTRAGTVKGTAGYMSPEQVRGDVIDGRSDVFSLGVVLWEMATGRRLFSAETELQELKMILGEPIRPPHEVEPSVPPELSEVAMKALERDLDKRYRSAREMAKAMQATCAHLLFDAEERAEFMQERFEDKITSTRRLFDSASKDEGEVGAAVEEFRRSSSSGRDGEDLQHRKPVTTMSAGKLGQVRPGASNGQLAGVSASRLKKVKPSKRGLEPTAPRPSAPASTRGEWLETEVSVATTPALKSGSLLWPSLAVVVALAVGGGVYWGMKSQGGDAALPPVSAGDPETGPVGAIPGVDLPRDAPQPGPVKAERPPPQPVNPVRPADQPSLRPAQPAVRERGELTLFILPEATVAKGGQLLGRGTQIVFSLPVGTHLVTVTGNDGVKRGLSLQVAAGRNRPQKFRLDDLPPQ